jgi:hypothetical protein
MLSEGMYVADAIGLSLISDSSISSFYMRGPELVVILVIEVHSSLVQIRQASESVIIPAPYYRSNALMESG